jgi:hypothetical protein
MRTLSRVRVSRLTPWGSSHALGRRSRDMDGVAGFCLCLGQERLFVGNAPLCRDPMGTPPAEEKEER